MVFNRGRCNVSEGDAICIRLIQEHHVTSFPGHPGQATMFDLLDRQYYWKTMWTQVDQYVRNCNSCQ
jgi:hypothetical protein